MTESLRLLLATLCIGAAWLRAPQAQAEDVQEPGAVLGEAPDPTRLDVARLPPEAIELERGMFARGPYLDAQLGALTLIGGAGDVSDPGPLLRVGVGYEPVYWLSLGLALEGSLHATHNRAPPNESSYEIITGLALVRAGIPLSVQALLWLQGEAGVLTTTGDVLKALGYEDAHAAGFAYGGGLGFEWHVRDRHHSLGVAANARMLPSLADGDLALGIGGSAYLRYVFDT